MSTTKKARNINIEEFFQSVIIFSIAGIFLLSILNGTVFRYVNKSHVPMIIFSVIVFIITGIVKLNHSLKYPKRSKKKPLYFLLFIFTIFVYFFMIPIKLKMSSIAHSSDITASNVIENSFTDNEQKTNSATQLVNGVIEIRTDNFYKWINELYKNIDTYIDTEVLVSGEVWLSDNFSENQFAVGRMMMVCCAADMQPIGILCELEDLSTMEDGSWVVVKGTIKKTPYKDTFDPVIKVASVTKTERPKSEYVSPY